MFEQLCGPCSQLLQATCLQMFCTQPPRVSRVIKDSDIIQVKVQLKLGETGSQTQARRMSYKSFEAPSLCPIATVKGMHLLPAALSVLVSNGTKWQSCVMKRYTSQAANGTCAVQMLIVE